MRAVIQRVSKAQVSVKEEVVASIQHGFLILLGIEDADTQEDLTWLVEKICKLRVFSDEDGLMNLSLQDVSGEVLVVSQFTLHAKTKKGTRPSFIKAAKPDMAKPMYNLFCQHLEDIIGSKVQKGIFGKHMDVMLVNDGPVTLIIDTKNKE